MTIFNKMKHKIVAGVLAAGMLLGAATVTAFAAIEDSRDTTASITFDAGQLRLLNVNNIVFKPGTISSVDKDYESTTGASIQVGDDRGSAAGWSLNATLGAFQIGTQPALAGAAIEVEGAVARPLEGNTSQAAPTPNGNVRLVAGTNTAERIATAPEDFGDGGWQIVWTDTNTTLTVPGGTAREGTATATITWSLEDVA